MILWFPVDQITHWINFFNGPSFDSDTKSIFDKYNESATAIWLFKYPTSVRNDESTIRRNHIMKVDFVTVPLLAVASSSNCCGWDVKLSCVRKVQGLILHLISKIYLF
jgi:hypothetical protein